MIGAFDKRTIIKLSGDVIKEIAQKYKGDMMSGALIETSARKCFVRECGRTAGNLIAFRLSGGYNVNKKFIVFRERKIVRFCH